MQPQTREPKRIFPGAFAMVILLGLVAAVVLVVGNRVFSIKTIDVEGNRLIDAETIIKLSDIHIGDSMFSLNTSKIRDGINSHEYLEYLGIWKSYPDRIIVSVEEDTPRAQIEWLGTLILLGKGGVVLERTTKMELVDGVPLARVSGIKEIQIGKPLIAAEGQIDAVNQVLTELIAQNIINEISELNVTILDNMYLITEDAVQVMLGASDSLSEKIRYMRVLLSEFRRAQIPAGGGVLDVTTGKFADFQPPK
jgi:cell division protein FtsQ